MNKKQLPLSGRLIALVARLAQFSRRYGRRLALSAARPASNGYTRSVYGPLLQNRWHDKTFRFCIAGEYGFYFSDFLAKFPEPFALVDIGANVGLYTLIAAANHNCRSCHVFEPNPAVFDSLRRNIELNGCRKAQLHNCAVSTVKGYLPFHAEERHTGTGSLVDNASPRADSITVASVNRTYFDEISILDRWPKIVKIDVEGHELIVIEELMNSQMWNDIRFLYFEVDKGRHEIGRTVEQLQRAGFVQLHRNDGRDPRHYDLMFARQDPSR